jgi:hypothetical protein
MKPHEIEWLKESLHHFVMAVTFTKKDGTDRCLMCTLKKDQLPDVEKDENGVIIKTTRAKTPNDAAMSVFDVSEQSWKSFRFDTVTNIEVVLE